MIVQTICIDIDDECAKVFEFVADLRNDKHWRREISSTNVKGSKLGAVAMEYSRLSKKVPCFLRQLTCTEWVEPFKSVYQTLDADKYYLRSVRICKIKAADKCTFTYLLEFDPSIVNLGIGFSLPIFLVNYITRRSMKKYLKSLKSVLEERKALFCQIS